jgi:CRP/FNR family transcriptional regulator, anaerobic regulatory protein
MESELARHIQSLFLLSVPDMQHVIDFFKPMTLARHDYFLKEQQSARYMGFVQGGLLREYFHHDGKEVTKWISGPGYFIVDLASFMFDQPARVNIQALTDCTLYTISKTDYQQLRQLVPKWPSVEKNFLARCFTVLEDRVMTHLSHTAEQRYDAFYQYNPDIFHQAPQQYLASMLGMTPETFSRIRKKRSSGSS